jgi:hypothetical protein
MFFIHHVFRMKRKRKAKHNEWLDKRDAILKAGWYVRIVPGVMRRHDLGPFWEIMRPDGKQAFWGYALSEDEAIVALVDLLGDRDFYNPDVLVRINDAGRAVK